MNEDEQLAHSTQQHLMQLRGELGKEFDRRRIAENRMFDHSMFAYPHFWLWHALFDGTPLCECWHSKELLRSKERV